MLNMHVSSFFFFFSWYVNSDEGAGGVQTSLPKHYKRCWNYRGIPQILRSVLKQLLLKFKISTNMEEQKLPDPDIQSYKVFKNQY